MTVGRAGGRMFVCTRDPVSGPAGRQPSAAVGPDDRWAQAVPACTARGASFDLGRPKPNSPVEPSPRADPSVALLGPGHRRVVGHPGRWPARLAKEMISPGARRGQIRPFAALGAS